MQTFGGLLNFDWNEASQNPCNARGYWSTCDLSVHGRGIGRIAQTHFLPLLV
jgi:hypothetical protein